MAAGFKTGPYKAHKRFRVYRVNSNGIPPRECWSCSDDLESCLEELKRARELVPQWQFVVTEAVETDLDEPRA